MKSRPLPLLALLGALFLTGCGDDGGGSETDYSGAWRGRTSHGGTVSFTVDGHAVKTFQVVDDQATVQLTKPVAIQGSSFSAQNSEGVSSPDSPAVAIQCTFDSATQCFGTYSIRRDADQWSGTFEASRP